MKPSGINCRILAAAAGALLFLLPPAWKAFGEERPGAPASTPESVSAGKAVFFEYCSGCHGRRADGRGPQSINLVPKPQNLRNAQFMKYLTEERMFASIAGGVRGTAMPAFELNLPAEKRWQAIHYLRSLTRGDALQISNAPDHQAVPAESRNPVAYSAEALASGKRLFLNYCASCHGARADGRGVIAPNLVPMPRNLVAIASWGEKPFIDYMPDSRLYDSITNGVPGTSMSPWIKVMNDSERWSLLLFLRDQAREERERSEKNGGSPAQ